MSIQSQVISGPSLSLCPPELAARRALGMATQGVGGQVLAIAASDTGSDEPGFYPAWRSATTTIVAISQTPLPSRCEAQRYMRDKIEREVVKLLQ